MFFLPINQIMTIGTMLHQWLTKLEWFSTLFPRIPVPIQKQIETKINNYCRQNNVNFASQNVNAVQISIEPEKRHERHERSFDRNRGGGAGSGGGSRERNYRNDERNEPRGYRSRSGEREREKNRDRDREYRNK